MGLYTEAIQQQEDALLQEIEIRRLVATGQEAAADALRTQIAREEELAQARAAGLSDEAIAALEAVQAQEELARAQEEAARAAREAAQALFESRQFDLDIAARQASLGGDDLGALQLRLQAQAEAELFRAQELLEAGRITEEMFRELSEVLTGEVNQTLAETQEAARLAALEITNNLNLRLLRAQGLSEEAQALQNLLELEDARRRGYTEQQLALLEQAQAAEAAARANQTVAAAARETEQTINRVARALNAPTGLRLSLLRYQASALSQPGAPQVYGTQPFASTSTAQTAPAAPTPNVTINVNAQPGQSPTEIARAVKREFDREARAGGTPYTLTGA